MDSLCKHGLLVYTWTHGIDIIHGIESDSWYSIGTNGSHTNERIKCCLYAGFFGTISKINAFFGELASLPLPLTTWDHLLLKICLFECEAQEDFHLLA